MQPLTTPHDYIDFALRRKWWIMIPFVLVMIGSFAVFKKLPKIYKATTLILVQPQKVPERYVEPTVTSSLADRLTTISQQILSRTSLEKVITELNLVRDLSNPMLMNQKLKSMRESIDVEVHTGQHPGESSSSFSISFDDRNPADAARIANKIASFFITENLRVREDQARGTSQFLQNELLTVKKKLEQKEEEIRRFKEQYIGELPAQLDANLRLLERLQRQFETNNESIISAQQRKANLENQISQIKKAKELTDQPGGVQDPLLTQLNNQKTLLQQLLAQYTDQHPDVIAARAAIENLEAQISQREEKVTPEPLEMSASADPMLVRLNVELQEVTDQVGRLAREQASLRKQIELYQRRVENVPKREEQMSTLLRDYSLLQENYRSLLDKKIQAQLAENLERRQQAEQFRILDPATPPSVPYKPDKRKVFGLAFVLGLGLGGGLAFLREQSDRSFSKIEDVEQFLGFPVVATIPRIETKKSTKKAA